MMFRSSIKVVLGLMLLLGWGSVAACCSEPVAKPEARGSGAAEFEGVVRLVALGDTGVGNATQRQVAAGIQARCDELGGCDGVLLLGDLIYDDGAAHPDDPRLTSRLDEPYATLHDRHGKRMTLYATLGNHDLGGSGWDETRVAHYVAYGRSRDWLHVPQAFWETQVGMVHLVGLHTSPLAYWGAEADLEAQGAMVKQVLATSSARWIVALGHHPYRSNGQHGNAGQYEGVPGDGFMVGGRFRAWVEEHLCGGVDVYMAGHEHNRQWLSPVADVPAWPPWLSSSERYPCRTRFGISGAGAKTTPLVDRGNPLDFGADTPGFVLLEFAPDQARIEMCDAEGRLEWSQVLVR